MVDIVLTDVVASITELKTNPMATVEGAGGAPLAILNRNEPVFYCVPADVYEHMLDALEDIELTKIVQDRSGQKEIAVNIDDL